MPVWLRWIVVGSLALPGIALGETDVTKGIYPIPLPPTTTQSAELNMQAVFDGEGEVAAVADLGLTAVQSAYESIVFTVSGTNVRVRRALEEYQYEESEEYCDREGPFDYTLNDYPCLKKATRLVTKTRVSVLEPTTKVVSGGTEVTLPLVDPLAKGDTSHITLTYKATGYVTPTLGTQRFVFLTPKVAFDLDTVRVRIDVQEELILKGGSATTKYEDSLAEGLATATVDSLSSGYSSRLTSALEEPQAFIKTTQALDPHESFEVTGVFATSWLWLYWPQTILIGLLFLAFVGLIIWGERRAAAVTQK